ncbi:MAG TPA: response regulator [Acidisarcina sp.]
MQAVFHHDFAAHPLPHFRRMPLPGYYAPREDPLLDVIYLVESDCDSRAYISALLASAEMKVITFDSADQCLAFTGRDTALCAVINISLPGMGGLELQRQLARKMQADSLAVLVRMTVKLPIPYWREASHKPEERQGNFLAGCKDPLESSRKRSLISIQG